MRLPRAVPSTVLLALILGGSLAGGCSDGPGKTGQPATPAQPVSSGATASPPTPSPLSTATPGPLAISEVLFGWEDAAPPLFQGVEPARPFPGSTPLQPTPTGPAAEWSLYIVRGQGPPERLYTTGRWLQTPQWATSGGRLIVPFWTRAATETGEWNRGLKLGADDATFASGSEIIGAVGSFPWPSPDGRQVLLHQRESVFLSSDLLTWRRLTGAQGAQEFAGWAPGGSHFLLSGGGGPLGGETTWLVPTAPGPGRALRTAVHFGGAGWDASGRGFAFPAAGEVFYYDVGANTARRLTQGFDYAYAQPRWSKDGSLLTSHGDVIDPSTGARTRVLEPGRTTGSALSPDGRYFLVSDDPHQTAPGYTPTPGESFRTLCSAAGATGLANKTYLLDRRTGRTTTVLDCQGFYVTAQWIGGEQAWLSDSRHVVLYTFNCWACEGSITRVTLLDVETGMSKTLGEGTMTGPAYVSPAGDRLLVAGETLRLYSQTGDLLRAISPPPGTEVTAAAWSPDGSSFVYILGPKGYRPGI